MGKFSSGLVNYVESVDYNGYQKSVFYSDFSTNFQVNDKVFIVNGNYDSDLLITSSNYTAGIDGYKVLEVDRCRITLDIDYTGLLPHIEDSIDEYIKIYHITNDREFDYVNNITSNSYEDPLISKFEYGLSNNVIYTALTFSNSTGIYGSYSSITASGFYQKDSSNGEWVFLPDFLGTSSIYFKTTGGVTYSLTNNNKLLIVGEDINISGQIFKQRGIYSFNYTTLKWEYSILYNKAYISKLNFRNGKFEGIWNDGIYGTYLNQIDWDSENAIWNSGIFINSNWKNGTINSKTDSKISKNSANSNLYEPQFTPETTLNKVDILTFSSSVATRDISYNSPDNLPNTSIVQSYYSSLNSNGLPIQTTDFSNNKGYGFNYIIDSNVERGFIENGNYINCNIGLTSSTSALDVYYGLSFSYEIQSKNGYFNFCDINTAALANSNIVDSNIINSNIINARLSSNQISDTVASGEYNSENGIYIISADLWAYNTDVSTISTIRGMLKLFISDLDLLRLGDFETIYVDSLSKEVYLSSFNDETKTYLNIENKYIFDYFDNTELSNTKIVVSRKNSNENKYSTYVGLSGSSYYNFSIINTNNYASIDIDLGYSLAWYKNVNINVYPSNSFITKTNVNSLFTSNKINISDFKSGILLNSTWKNGSNFNDISNRLKVTGSTYSIQIPSGSTNSIFVDISTNIYNKYDVLNINDYVWINGIDYIDTFGNITELSSTFKIQSVSDLITYRKLGLLETTNVLNTIVSGGTFSIKGVNPNYVSINKFKIENSKIESGLFKNSLILNSVIENTNFNNFDQTLTIGNISKLRFINMLLKSDNNIFKSGLVYKSHIINTNWTDGIAFNSIVFGNTFSNGLFKNGYWITGVFNDAIFADSDDVVATNPSYDSYGPGYYRAWRNGTFNSGKFYNSTWIDGTFNNGRLYNSNWYGGTFNNGILGIKNSPYLTTTMGYYANLGIGATSTTFNGGIVESAIVGGLSSVYWNDGKFNDGSFTSFGTGYPESIWYDGDFNGGKFAQLAKWKNGKFNNGKFLSYYGWTLSNSTNILDYSWENGKFNGGQFGTLDIGTNSTWYNGEFSDGIFGGKVWNNGVFTKGNFYGSLTLSVASQSKTEYNLVNSFTHSYYGLWRNGYFVDSEHLGNKNEKIYTALKRGGDNKPNTNIASMNNALWVNGTFSHPLGTMENSVWLKGSFYKGNFKNSSFNPFVDRRLSSGEFIGSTDSNNFSFEYNRCEWVNGKFIGGNFYISEWTNGTFESGYMLGGIWRNGVWNYGTAENCYWESGTWRNGNWYGTNFDYKTIDESTLTVDDNLTKNVLYNIASVTGTNSVHLLNAFTGSLGVEKVYDPNFYYESVGTYSGWTQSGSNNWGWRSFYYMDDISHVIVVHDNNYHFNGSSASNTLYALSASGSSFTEDIFEPNISYDIYLSIFVNYPGAIYTYPTILQVSMGYTVSNLTCVMGYNNFSLSLSSDPSLWAIYDPRFSIKKLTGLANSDTDILVVSIKRSDKLYDFTYNNTLYPSFGSTISLSGTISFPPLVLTSVGTNNSGSALVSLQYGNGKFVSGVWENGVWNNGYRTDSSITKCEFFPVAGYINVSKVLHRIQLNLIDYSNISLFKIGDFVSVGNIVSIDINGNRKLIKDKFKVIFVGTINIVLEVTLSYPILEIIKDSENHLIYISKNIWLSGAFLNGYFEGIWNYGLFNGYPYITYMENSHWIDGIFDGGHFMSITNSVFNANNSETEIYNTGLIQNFIFDDNNIANPYNFRYQSWIDVNYSNSSMTNIGDRVLFSTQSDGIYPYSTPAYKRVIPDLNGYITYDVLSSNSTLRKGNSNEKKILNLGIKYKIYKNYINNSGYFTNPFSTTLNPPGLSNFTNDGWTFSIAVGIGDVNYEASISDSSLNINAAGYITKLDNNLIDILPNRYSIVEIVESSNTGAVRSYTQYNKATYSLFPSHINYSTSIGSTTPIKEYYYNKQDLGLYTHFYGASIDQQIKYDNISYYEVDMIPFFQTTTESNVDQAIRIPWTAIAPFIDYSNSNFNYIGNINLKIDSAFISNPFKIYTLDSSGNIFSQIGRL